MAALTPRQGSDSNFMCKARTRDFSVIVGRGPITKKSGLPLKPEIGGIEFVICNDTGRGNCSHPPRCRLPRFNRLSVIDTNRPVFLNDPAAALRGLPFES